MDAEEAPQIVGLAPHEIALVEESLRLMQLRLERTRGVLAERSHQSMTDAQAKRHATSMRQTEERLTQIGSLRERLDRSRPRPDLEPPVSNVLPPPAVLPESTLRRWWRRMTGG
jgi:hypothetical protein